MSVNAEDVRDDPDGASSTRDATRRDGGGFVRRVNRPLGQEPA
jgi:hypothetical protein